MYISPYAVLLLWSVLVPDDCWEELCCVHVGDVEGGGDAELAHQHQDGEDHTLLYQSHVHKGSGLRFF
jgi:hypothetical protein